MRNPRPRLFFAIAGIVSIILASAAPAYAGSAPRNPEPEAGQAGLVPWVGPLPGDIKLSKSEPVPGELPEATSAGIWNMEMAGIGRKVNTYEWESETSTLVIYSTEDPNFWSSVVADFLPDQKVKILPASNSKATIEAVMSVIIETGGKLDDGNRIVTAIPAKDGSSITLGIESASESKAVQPLREEHVASSLRTDVPLILESAPEVQPATRNASGASTYWLGGNLMRTNAATGAGYYSCSTGFLIGNISTSEPGMLSAEHCGRDKPFTSWQYSTANNPTQNHIGDFHGFLTSVYFNSDTALWAGGRLAQDRMILRSTPAATRTCQPASSSGERTIPLLAPTCATPDPVPETCVPTKSSSRDSPSVIRSPSATEACHGQANVPALRQRATVIAVVPYTKWLQEKPWRQAWSAALSEALRRVPVTLALLLGLAAPWHCSLQSQPL